MVAIIGAERMRKESAHPEIGGLHRTNFKSWQLRWGNGGSLEVVNACKWYTQRKGCAPYLW